MKHVNSHFNLKIVTLTLACGLLSACGSQQAPGQFKQVPLETTGTIHTDHGDILVAGSGTLDFETYKGHSLYVEFMSSHKLTDSFRKRFSALGFQLTSNAQAADITIEMMGDFSFQKPQTRRQVVDLGRVVDQTPQGQTDTLADKASIATRTPGLELGPLLTTNLGSNIVLGTAIADSIMRLTGIQGWLNKAIAGDERGFCVGTKEMCKDWKKFDQLMRLGVIISSKAGTKNIIRAAAHTKDEQIELNPLFHAAMGELTRRIFPATAAMQPAEPASATPPEDTTTAVSPITKPGTSQ
jgi:hypothetical protein